MNRKIMLSSAQRPVAVLVLVFVVLSAAYSLATRLKYGPDEPAHFIYIRSLATEFAPPAISHEETPTEDYTASHEGHQPPLYYAVMAVPYAAMEALGVESDTIWRILRLLNIVIGVLWVLAVYALTREFFSRQDYALVTTAFVSLIPTACYMSGVINNETLITLLFTLAMTSLLVFFKSGRMTTREAALLGVLIGLAALTKAQGLLLVPLLAVAGFVVCRRERWANTGEVLKSIGIVLGIAALLSGWWFARSWIVYGTIMPHSLYRPIASGLWDLVLMPSGPRYAVFATTGLYGYFWVPFWLVWPFVGNFAAYFYPLLGVTLTVLVGLVIRVRQNADLDRPSLAYLLLAPILVYVFWLRYVLVTDPMANLQGRLLLGVAAIIGIAWVLGFDGLLRSARAKRAGVIAGLSVMLAANLVVIVCTIILYSRP